MSQFHNERRAAIGSNSRGRLSAAEREQAIRDAWAALSTAQKSRWLESIGATFVPADVASLLATPLSLDEMIALQDHMEMSLHRHMQLERAARAGSRLPRRV